MNAKDYSTRADLEQAVLSTFGPDISVNLERPERITGTRDELKRLFLTDKTTIHGIKCVITDFPTSKVLADKQKERDARKKRKEPEIIRRKT